MTPLVCDQGVGAADLKFTVFKRVAQVAGRSEFTFANRDDDRREIHLALVLVPVLAGWPPIGLPLRARRTGFARRQFQPLGMNSAATDAAASSCMVGRTCE